MLESLTPQPQDKILQIMGLYRADTRPGKIDLGVGVYKDATGLTPIMRAVKEAERRLWDSEMTKTYTAIAGEAAYNTAMVDLILGPGFEDRAASVATPGGTGAVRQAMELVHFVAPGTRIWMSDPTWPLHPAIIRHLGLPAATYTYFDPATGGLLFDRMIADLEGAERGDVVLLHGCCHNPTGANLSAEQWVHVVELLNRKGLIPFVDLAYQGFGDGLATDAAATRLVAKACPEVLIAASCSKNFGIYRERTGILIALGDTSQREVTQGNLAFLNRQNFSFPPDHGARIVTTILNDPALRLDWEAELEEVRNSMLALRKLLADELRRATNSDRFDFVADHRGMFSRLGLTEAQVLRLRDEHAIYMVGDSRINIAGLNSATVSVLAQAVAAVL